MSNKMTVKDRLKTYRKHPGSFLVMLLVMLGALLTFSVLLFLIAYILINGVPHIKLSLFCNGIILRKMLPLFRRLSIRS